MKSDSSNTPPHPSGGGRSASTSADGKRKGPEWANGLRRLYDSVVEEPLPDSFQDLLNKLDAKD